MNRVFEQGYQAFELGKPKTANPYLEGRSHHRRWEDGYEAAMEDAEPDEDEDEN